MKKGKWPPTQEDTPVSSVQFFSQYPDPDSLTYGVYEKGILFAGQNNYDYNK